MENVGGTRDKIVWGPLLKFETGTVKVGLTVL